MAHALMFCSACEYLCDKMNPTGHPFLARAIFTASSAILTREQAPIDAETNIMIVVLHMATYL